MDAVPKVVGRIARRARRLHGARPKCQGRLAAAIFAESGVSGGKTSTRDDLVFA